MLQDLYGAELSELLPAGLQTPAAPLPPSATADRRHNPLRRPALQTA
jgi:hypothetical protein